MTDPMVSVVVPWRDEGDPYRRRAMLRTLEHLYAVFPDSDVRLVDDAEEPWARGPSIDLGVEQARHEVVAVCDSDMLVPFHSWWQAVAMAAETPGQVIPFTRYHYLSAGTTDALYAEPGRDWLTWPPQWTRDVSVGGACVFTKDTHRRAYGHDPRLRGWGWQDHQFAWACETFVAPLRRVEGVAVHLYHPVHETNDEAAPTYAPNGDLAKRYREVLGDRDAMLAIVAERGGTEVRPVT